MAVYPALFFYLQRTKDAHIQVRTHTLAQTHEHTGTSMHKSTNWWLQKIYELGYNYKLMRMYKRTEQTRKNTRACTHTSSQAIALAGMRTQERTHTSTHARMRPHQFCDDFSGVCSLLKQMNAHSPLIQRQLHLLGHFLRLPLLRRRFDPHQN